MVMALGDQPAVSCNTPFQMILLFHALEIVTRKDLSMELAQQQSSDLLMTLQSVLMDRTRTWRIQIIRGFGI
jgi:hypothetical protein